VGIDPKFWEELRKNTERAVQEEGEEGIRLRGGPMDGWLVREDAPAFRPDWYQSLPGWSQEELKPGHYERRSDTEAEWVEDET
jgi:hypothetical protein